MTVPPLVLRLLKGSPLTAAEGDENLTILKDFINGLSALFEIVFNTDGTLKPGVIGTASLTDRSVTQAKLDWTHLFYGTAAGTDNYTLTISPDSGFVAGSLGDGASSAFWAVVKFTNANTGASTLDVNGVGSEDIRKLGTNNLVAGDIIAGGVYILVWDGTYFQLINPSLNLDPEPIIAHGIPTFLASPVTILSGVTTAVAPTTYNTLAADGIPATASAIILEAVCGCGSASLAGKLNVRKSSLDPFLVLAYGNIVGSFGDGASGVNQGIYPFLVTGPVLSFDYEIVNGFTNGGVDMRLIGYIS